MYPHTVFVDIVLSSGTALGAEAQGWILLVGIQISTLRLYLGSSVLVGSGAGEG